MIIEDIVCEESSKSLAVLDSLFARITQLEKDLRDEKKNSKRLAIKNSFVKKELNDMKKGLKKYFGDDQIQALTKKKIKNWSNATVKKAMIIKKKGGKSFLDFVRNNVAPLPATRILQSRQNLWDASSRQSIKSEKVLVTIQNKVKMWESWLKIILYI